MKTLAFFLALLTTPQLFGFIDTISVHSKVDRTKVYFSGAEITRRAAIALHPGRKILKFSGLAGRIDPNTIECSRLDNSNLIAIKHRPDFSGHVDSISNRIKQLKLLAEEKKSNLHTIHSEIEERGLSILFSTPDNDIIQSSYKYLTTIQNKLEFELNSISHELDKLRSIGLQQKTNVYIAIHCYAKMKDTLYLRYFISNASWRPVIDFLVGKSETEVSVSIVRNAKVNQSTGEEWSNVNIQFCTSRRPLHTSIPSFSIPGLQDGVQRSSYSEQSEGIIITGKIFDAYSGKPIPNALIEIWHNGGAFKKAYSNRDGEYTLRVFPRKYDRLIAQHHTYESANFEEIQITGVGPVQLDIPMTAKTNQIGISDVIRFTAPTVIGLVQSSNGTTSAINASGILIGSAIQVISKLLTTSPQNSRTGIQGVENHRDLHPAREPVNQPTIAYREYKSSQRFTIPSDNADYFVRLENTQVPANFIYYAAPALRPEVFRAIEIEDWKTLIPIPTEIRVYQNGMILHKAGLNPQKIGDRLRIFLSPTNGIAIRKKQVALKKKSRKKSTISDARWNIEIQNNLNKPIVMVVEDQFPIANQKSVSMESMENDATSVDKRRGILTWRLQLEPEEQRTLQHGYTVKFPSGLRLYNN